MSDKGPEYRLAPEARSDPVMCVGAFHYRNSRPHLYVSDAVPVVCLVFHDDVDVGWIVARDGHVTQPRNGDVVTCRRETSLQRRPHTVGERLAERVRSSRGYQPDRWLVGRPLEVNTLLLTRLTVTSLMTGRMQSRAQVFGVISIPAPWLSPSLHSGFRGGFGASNVKRWHEPSLSIELGSVRK